MEDAIGSMRAPMDTDSQALSYAIRQYYKNEYERADRCLKDILRCVEPVGASHAEIIDAIVGRLISHYGRTVEK